ncbi:OLC1v1005186C1 [Oldenlandia corymbosa var. corymbosa]|uniref:OLC1v1005186C1 n=1 Tax=Oldenlandia corymbosa var. corymbosa TaxID=529605 RepID=A0AAV1DEL8_OLDCO|nr:OLC1v1005186C1 [Oldenlandia corymbosa var. corymbosa]
MAKKWLATAVVFVLVLSNPEVQALGSNGVAAGPTPPQPWASCLIDCGVKMIRCVTGCLISPICYFNCGVGNIRCITICNETFVEEYQFPPLFQPETMAIGREGAARIEIGTIEAVAKITSSAGTVENGVKGSLQFFQDSTERTIHIKGRIVGLSPGIHGLSIHSTGSCDNVGPHFNPLNWVRDLGNIVAGPDGIAEVSIKDETNQLNGVNSVLGRGILVHSGVDDLGRNAHEDTNINGNSSGAAVGCGIIKIKPSI